MTQELETNLAVLRYSGERNCFEIKKWLWEKKDYALTVRMIGEKYTYEIWNTKTRRFIEYGVKYDSPIEAEIDGIKSAMESLCSQTAVPPINTKTNDC